MKKYLFLLVLPLVALFACVADESAYQAQQKEQVNVDDVDYGGDKGDTPAPGELIAGTQLVKIMVDQPDGSTVERRFKYFMPSTLRAGEPISLVFQFHDAVTFNAGTAPGDPIANVSSRDQLNQTASRENWITCFPAATRTDNEDTSGKLDWNNTENELAFIDAIIEYFKECTPKVDLNRVYAVGRAAGGNFAFQLALGRADKIAAITTYPATYSLPSDAVIPSRAVPVLMINKDKDTKFPLATTLTNMGKWAEGVGSYYSTDRVFTEDAILIEGYAIADTYTWRGAKGDALVYAVKGAEGDLNLRYLLPYIATFMASHTLDGSSAGVFVTTSEKEINALPKQKFEVSCKTTEGAVISLRNAPATWSPVIEDGVVKLTAPADFFGNPVDREGEFEVVATLGTESATATVKYKLSPRKTYFTEGDIYYNDNNEPAGIVVWVNPTNALDAKIMSLEGPGSYNTIQYGPLGLEFGSPDRNDGQANTTAMVAYNAGLTKPNTSDNACYVWAAEYEYKGVSGWYLPAIEELKEMGKHKEAIVEQLTALGFTYNFAGATVYSSTTELIDGPSKRFYYFSMGTLAEGYRDAADEYTGYVHVRAFKRVSM